MKMSGLAKETIYSRLESGSLESVDSDGGQKKITRESLRAYLKLPPEGAMVDVT